MPKSRRQRSNDTELPKIKAVVEAPLKVQVEIFKKCKAQLDPGSRKLLKKQGRHVFPENDLQVLVHAITDFWQRQLELCRSDPNYFLWPETQIWQGDGHLSTINWEELGALKLFSYSVDQESNLTEAQRRFSLDLVFASTIPPFTRWEYVEQWSTPETARRLLKMANCLASLARLGQYGERSFMNRPVRRWIADLHYLKVRYYRDHFRFDWPDPNALEP